MSNSVSDNSDLKFHWSTVKESGSLFGMKFLRFVHDVFGRWLVSLLLLPTVAYFLALRPFARRSSQEYLNLHYEKYPGYWQAKPNIWNTAKHMQTFSETVVDKLLSWSVELDIDQFVIKHPEQIEALRADPRGQLIIGSHFGNLEYCRGFMHRYKNKIVNILVHDKHSKNYNALMQELNPNSRLNVFQVEEFDIPTMLQIKAKVDAGEWVFIAGDRSPLSGVERTAAVEFFDKTAYFPIGPYMLAKGLGCPVKLMFSYRDYQASRKEQKIHFEVVPFADRVELDRSKRDLQLQAYAQQFANELERNCAKAPYQWFNFYNFWAKKA